MWTILLLGCAVALLMNGYVTYLIWKADHYDHLQSILQTALIWLVPVLGAWIVYGIFRKVDHKPLDAGRGYSQTNTVEPQEADPDWHGHH